MTLTFGKQHGLNGRNGMGERSNYEARRGGCTAIRDSNHAEQFSVGEAVDEFQGMLRELWGGWPGNCAFDHVEEAPPLLLVQRWC